MSNDNETLGFGLEYTTEERNSIIDDLASIIEKKTKEANERYNHVRMKDDDEPVTEEWVRLVGEVDHEDCFVGPAMWFDFANGGELLIDHMGGWQLKTRGDVRMFAKALGIKLKQ